MTLSTQARCRRNGDAAFWSQSTREKEISRTVETIGAFKLTSHTMKIWERVVEKRLRKMVNFGEGQYGFMPGKSAADAIFALR